MQKILIAEDDINISTDLKLRLQEEGFLTEAVYDGLLAEKMIVRNAYDCIVLDINMPGKNGLEVCKSIRSHGVNTPILFLTAFDEAEDKVTGFESGADDYLTKPFYFKELLARIRALLKRRPLNAEISPILSIAGLSIDLGLKKVIRDGEKIKLTAREFDILVLLASSNGNTVSKKDLIEKIWGTRVEVNTNTIEVFINSIRNKIDKGHNEKLIHTRPGFGYYLNEKPDES
ncbi:MAG: response regulator transcription factor [Cyclobacteriaceae bacterium]|jgi:DNA-binding response OmpR family regulator|nr:response regulator transcription factor [Cyclobacteriaceae bacterium]